MLAVERVDGQMEATSLIGPMRGSISFDWRASGARSASRPGRRRRGALRLRALLENEAAAARTDFDGSIRLV